jgi:hypothetical protein
LYRSDRKRHFEPIATQLGCITVLCALASGIGPETRAELGYSLSLVAAGATLAAVALKRRRFSLFAEGVLGAYVGLAALVHRASPSDIGLAFYYCASSVMVLGLLVVVALRCKEDG